MSRVIPSNIAGTINAEAIVRSDGQAAVPVSDIQGLVNFEWDRVDATYPDTVTEVFTFSKNSVTAGVITITYTDSTKANLLSAVRS